MSDSPRILVVTPDFPPANGGIQILSHRIAAELRAFTPTVVTVGHPAARAFDERASVEVVRVPVVPGIRPLTVAGLNSAALALAARRRPDVILSLHIVAAPAAALVRHQLGIPFVQYVHAKEIGAKPSLARFALRRADRIVAVSRYTRELALGAGARADRVVLIHPGVDPPTSRAFVARKPRPTLLTISRLEDRYKGHDVVLRALPLVRARIPDVQWRIIGDGPLRPTLEDRARTLGLNGAVAFLGAVRDDERDAELAAAHAFCMVSRLPPGRFAGEGFGIVYLEANCHDLPVIAGWAGGAVDAVVDGTTGVLVDPEDHIAVADAISAMLTDSARASRMGRSGRTRAEQLSWAAAAAALEQELLSVVA